MNWQKGFAPIIILFIIAAALTVGGGGWYVLKKVTIDRFEFKDPHIPPYVTSGDLAETCTLKPRTEGKCAKLFAGYYFDSTKGCIEFRGGGCTGFVPFKTLEECSATCVDISGWQTYRNEQYEFEVKYPAGWIIEERKNFVNFDSPQTRQARDENIKNCSDNSTSTVCRLDFAPMDIIFRTSTPTFIGQPSPKVKTVINTITFERYEADLPPEYHDVYYETSANGKMYLFAVVPSRENTLVEFLSTFKFISPIGSCKSDNDCQSGFVCYNSVPAFPTPQGIEYGTRKGDQRCHKRCASDADCRDQGRCIEEDIFTGDVANRVRFCSS